MELREKKFKMKTDGFLPRHISLECHHQPDNKIFGIKFRISPVIFEKKINFSEYKEYIFPLSYLLEQSIINKIKNAASFEARTKIAINHFEQILKNNPSPLPSIRVVSAIVDHCSRTNDFTTSIDDFARQFDITARTMQRYFENATSISTKKVLQILRIRKATSQLANAPENFHFGLYGYYDHSHFYKHLKQFLQKDTLMKLQPHLRLLKGLHK